MGEIFLYNQYAIFLNIHDQIFICVRFSVFINELELVIFL